MPPRALRFKRPLHRCNACNPKRNAKAELNRRSQIREVLTGTGVRVAKWNPVLELHQPLRLCRPPPELLGQRDKNSNAHLGIVPGFTNDPYTPC